MKRRTRFQCNYRGKEFLSLRDLYESFKTPAVSYASFRYRVLKKNYDPAAAALEPPQRAIQGRTDWQAGQFIPTAPAPSGEGRSFELLGRTEQKYKGTFLWNMRCFCGTEFIAIPSALSGGRVKSCGCLPGSRRRTVGT